MPRSKPLAISSAALVVGLALVYVAAAKFGFELAVVADQVTLVWPPSGIALGVMLFAGRRVWPGVLLGAFVANATTGEPLVVAGSIAMGNTLEALLALKLLEIGGFRAELARIRDVLALVFLAATLSTTVAATVGSFSLAAGGLQPWSALGHVWRDWWIGDAVGILTVTPPLLAWFAAERPPFRWSFGAVALAIVTPAVALLAFAQPAASMANAYPVYYLAFPIVAWGALRFGLRGSTLVVLVMAYSAVLTAKEGLGPFVGASEDPLLLLQLFVSVLALTSLLLGAAASERDAAHEDLKLQDRRKDQFLATLAHELRSPLAPLVAAAHILRSKADDPSAVRRLEPVLSR